MGGAGDDRIRMGAGSDVIDGGDGIDVVDFSDASATVTVNLDAGTSSVSGDTDTLKNIENVIGSIQADTINGDDDANRIDGAGGGDTIDGGGGDDTVIGGDGSDLLKGGAGADVIYGDAASGLAGSGSNAGTTAALVQSLDSLNRTFAEFQVDRISDFKEYRGLEDWSEIVGPVRTLTPSDASFSGQWYLENPNAAVGGVDINITDVWDDYTGAGVKIGIIDDGIDYRHSEFSENYLADLDYDALGAALGLGSDDPFTDGLDDFHGTSVAGVIGASLNEGEIVGVARIPPLPCSELDLVLNGVLAN